SWAVTDPNPLDTHTYEIFLSADSGSTFALLAGNVSTTVYTLDTRAYPSLYTYRLKVVATDTGEPAMKGAALTPVFNIINSLSPRQFSLLKPLEDSFPSVFDLRFSWERSADPEGGAVTYDLRYSTSPGADEGVTVPGLTQTNHTPALNSLLMDTQYFWRVSALDQYARKTESAVGSFMLRRAKAKTSDGLMTVEILSGLPAQGYIGFQDAMATKRSALELAGRNSESNRLVKLLSAPAWEAQIKDIDGVSLPSSGVSARITYAFPAASVLGADDNALADIQHLKLARLNESGGRWEIPSDQTVEPVGRQVSLTSSGLYVFSVLASISPAQLLSGLTSFPNPFAPGKDTARIRYTLSSDASVRIRIYTPLGDLVRVLECPHGGQGCGQGTVAGSVNEMTWDGKNGAGFTAANGMYLAEVYAKSAAESRRELLHLGVLK
ncbi:MAG: hypothetical protein PHV33_14530, partial [Elusimicrobiales bacterium]|nr:hypothetical protein [Elusimicrobiales bacterium]